MTKSNQRITKIKEDLILKLLEQAESMNIEDAVVVQPAGSQLLERPKKGYYRQYVRNNFLKGVNGILQIGTGTACPPETIDVSTLATFPTRNDTMTAILDGLVFITRRYKAPITNQILEPNPELCNQITGKPMLQFSNMTFRNIEYRSINKSELNTNGYMFMAGVAGYIPIPIALNPQINIYSYISVGLSDSKLNYVESADATGVIIGGFRSNLGIGLIDDNLIHYCNKHNCVPYRFDAISKTGAYLIENKYQHTTYESFVFPFNIPYSIYSNWQEVSQIDLLSKERYSDPNTALGCVYTARFDCVPCNPSPPPTNDPPPTYNECPMFGLLQNLYEFPDPLLFNGISHSECSFLFGNTPCNSVITRTTVGYPIPNCRPK